MSRTDVAGEGASEAPAAGTMEMKLEVVVVPVSDVDRAKAFYGGLGNHAGTEGRAAGPAPDRASYGSFASFSDPDGNGWLLQEIKERLPGR
jgi:hypothetical protein